MSHLFKWLRSCGVKAYVLIRLLLKHVAIWRTSGVILGKALRYDLFTDLEGHVSLGDCVDVCSSRIGEGTYISNSSTLRHTQIGRFCSIADYVRSGLGAHPTSGFVSTHPAFFSTIGQAGFSFVDRSLFEENRKVKGSEFSVVIGNDVWIGSGVIIMDGVQIGDGAIVGAGAVVTKDLEPYSINVGVPARKISMRFSDSEIQRLLRFKWWDRGFDWIRTHSYLFNDIPEMLSYANRSDHVK